MAANICKDVCDMCPGELVGRFSWQDILLFAGILIIAAAIKLFYTIRGLRGKDDTDEIQTGRRREILSIVMSLCVNYLSVVTILGTSAEMYNVNTSFWIATIAIIPAAAIINHLLLPVLNNISLTSLYEYLEHRFARYVRVCACVVLLLNMLLVISVTLYALSLVLNTASGLSIELSIGVCGIICLCFTTIGGRGSTLWTDLPLTIIIIAGLVTVSVKGSLDVGGLDRVWQIARENGRIDFLDWNPDPTVRHSVWSLLIGSCVCQLTIYSTYQTLTHRCNEIKSLKTSQIALYTSIFPLFLLSTLICLVGLVIFAAYHDCDPVVLGHIKARDQLLPFLVMDVLTPLPGLAGFFVVGLFTASLCSVSSGLNSLSVVFLEDVMKVIWEMRTSLFISKVIAFVFGVFVLALAYLAMFLKQTVLQQWRSRIQVKRDGTENMTILNKT